MPLILWTQKSIVESSGTSGSLTMSKGEIVSLSGGFGEKSCDNPSAAVGRNTSVQVVQPTTKSRWDSDTGNLRLLRYQ